MSCKPRLTKHHTPSASTASESAAALNGSGSGCLAQRKRDYGVFFFSFFASFFACMGRGAVSAGDGSASRRFSSKASRYSGASGGETWPCSACSARRKAATSSSSFTCGLTWQLVHGYGTG